MPEIFEVKRICSYLQQANLEGKRIEGIAVLPGGDKILRQYPITKWRSYLAHQRLLSITTKAKYTFLQLEQGTLVWHYRFTGVPHVEGFSYLGQLDTIFQLPIQTDSNRYCRFKLFFASDLVLRFIDIRCLADVRYFPSLKKEELKIFHRLAPDVSNYLPEPFAKWQARLRQKTRDLKTELKDQQTYPSGIGNYLSCEILARAKLNPWQQASNLSRQSYKMLCEAILKVKQHCEHHVDYSWFQVFNRRHCLSCKTAINRTKHRPTKSSQTTHYCPQCQQDKIKNQQIS